MPTALATRVDIGQVDLAPKVRRTDAIQSFVTQEAPLVVVRCVPLHKVADGAPRRVPAQSRPDARYASPGSLMPDKAW